MPERRLEDYAGADRIDWRRLAEEDKKLVGEWMREHSPVDIGNPREVQQRFPGTEMLFLRLVPEFWDWLAERRAAGQQQTAAAN